MGNCIRKRKEIDICYHKLYNYQNIEYLVESVNMFLADLVCPNQACYTNKYSMRNNLVKIRILLGRVNYYIIKDAPQLEDYYTEQPPKFDEIDNWDKETYNSDNEKKKNNLKYQEELREMEGLTKYMIDGCNYLHSFINIPTINSI